MNETIGTAVIGLGVACLALSLATEATAAPTLRKQLDQRGDFAWIGNSGGFECASTEVAPSLGTVSCPSSGTADSSPDIFWRSSDPPSATATADASILAANARTTAVLGLPVGAVVNYARLYWAGFLMEGVAADTQVRIERPGGALDQFVASDAAYTVRANGGYFWYQSTADVTALVASAGPGPFRISDMASVELPQLANNSDAISAWSLVVFYRLDSEPPRNLALFDGLDWVRSAAPQTVKLSGFKVPSGGFDAKLGVIAYEGEADTSGDVLSFNGSALGDAVNPVDNFFNGSRSWLGAAQSTSGDLPQLSGAAASMSGFDLDVVDVKGLLKPNDTTATLLASSTGDSYLLGAFITSISTLGPDFAASTKAVTDLNGGVVAPNDRLEYTISAHNSGNDGSLNTIVSDPLPVGVSYEPDSIRISEGDNAGAKTDAKDGDQAEYDPITRVVSVRMGAGADGVQGGMIAAGASVEVRFRVTVDAKATGSVLNQAVITAGGQQGAASASFATDGNGEATGSPPTEIVVVGCSGDCNAGGAGTGPGVVDGGAPNAGAAGDGGAGGTDSGGTDSGGAEAGGTDSGGTEAGGSSSGGAPAPEVRPSVDRFEGGGCACGTNPHSSSESSWLVAVLALVAARARRSKKCT